MPEQAPCTTRYSFHRALRRFSCGRPEPWRSLSGCRVPTHRDAPPGLRLAAMRRIANPPPSALDNCRASRSNRLTATRSALVYNTLIMFHPRRFLRVPARLLAAAALITVSFAQTKRPLNHGDYDGWRSIVGQKLSADGKFLVYGRFPQEGDGEVVIRNLATGKEQREPAGVRPAPTPPTPDQEGPAPEARGATLTFSADSKTVVFSTFPPKAESDKAKKDKKPAPKDGMVIVDLASGTATRVERVKRFAMPEKASGLLVYLKESPDAPAGGAGTSPAAAPKPEGDQRSEEHTSELQSPM